MTIAEQVLFILGAPFQQPLTQVDIAYRIGQNPPSVRRTCQQLQKAGKIHVADFRGLTSTPRLALGPMPILSTAPSQDTGFSNIDAPGN